MNTQQVEQMTGISRQNIRYYEKEGLLSPKRDEGNGYRIYSREDVEILKRVKMLRMLGMQLDVIRSILHGEESLEEAVVRQRERLLEHQKQLKAAADMCEKIRRMGEKDLDVDACLEQMEAMERQGGMFARFRDDYKKAAEWEDKKEFSFYVDANIKTKEEILRSVWEYGQTHGMELQKVHGREEALFLADGQMYRAACLRLRPRERGKEEETKRRALIVCRRCTREKRTGRMRFLQAVHIVLRNIRRQKKRSALQVLVCMAAVCFGMLYQDNIGGEQQRVAIARALAAEGDILLADEPTGNLDTENEEIIAGLLLECAHEKGYTVVLVTHSLELARKADVIYRMKDGRMMRYDR